MKLWSIQPIAFPLLFFFLTTLPVSIYIFLSCFLSLFLYLSLSSLSLSLSLFFLPPGSWCDAMISFLTTTFFFVYNSKKCAVAIMSERFINSYFFYAMAANNFFHFGKTLKENSEISFQKYIHTYINIHLLEKEIQSLSMWRNRSKIDS